MAGKVLLGVKKFSSNKNNQTKNFEVMVLAGDASARDIEKGTFGKVVEEVFVPESHMGRLTVADLGKEVLLDYEIVNGRAYLIGFQVKK